MFVIAEKCVFIIPSLFLGIFICCFNLNCGINGTMSKKPASTSQSVTASELKIPDGSELKMVVKRGRDGKVTVFLRNDSTENVYFNHFPGENAEKVPIVYYLEKKNEKSGLFEKFKDVSWHFSPGIHPFSPQKSTRFDLELHEKGEFRVIIRYFIDKSIYNLYKNKNEGADFSDAEFKMFGESIFAKQSDTIRVD